MFVQTKNKLKVWSKRLGILVFASSLLLNCQNIDQEEQEEIVTLNTTTIIKTENNEYFLSRPKALIENSGYIYVLDSDQPFIKKFDSEGKFLNQFIIKGQGTGELLRPMSISKIDSNNLLVFDGKQKRFTKFSSEGEYLESFQLKKKVSQFISNAYGDIVYQTSSKSKDRKGSIIKTFLKSSSETILLDSFKVLDKEFLPKFKTMINHPFSEKRFIISLFDGKTMIINSKNYNMKIYDKYGKIISEKKKVFEEIDINNNDKEMFFSSQGFISPSGERTKRVKLELKKIYKFPYHKGAVKETINLNDGKFLLKTYKANNKYEYFEQYDKNGKFVSSMKIELGKISNPVIYDGKSFFQLAKNNKGFWEIKKHTIK